MKLNFNHIIFALVDAIDMVENEVLGVSNCHSRRVAYLCLHMAQNMKLSDKDCLELVALALLHDNALAEYAFEEYGHAGELTSEQIMKHCLLGENNVEKVPLSKKQKNAILYHHERADGKGPFGKNGEETPLFSKLIFIADTIDRRYSLVDMDEKMYDEVKDYVNNGKGTLFDPICADCFIKSFTFSFALNFEKDYITKQLSVRIPNQYEEFSLEQIKGIAYIFASVIDYKSNSTSRHSIEIARKAEMMADYYGCDDEMKSKLYLAGALHDIGKLIIPNHLLEKKEKLTKTEYMFMQLHAYETYRMLMRIDGIGEVLEWASYHHEKLDGSGYPFGLKAEKLSKNTRVIACLDIYQALLEERCYKDKITHKEAMDILYEMVENNKLDGEIVKDIDIRFGIVS